MAWDEWEQIKADVASRPSTGTRLNQLDGGGGSGGGPALFGPDLASTPAQKKAAANSIEKHLEPGTGTAGNVAEESTGAAVREFGPKDGHGWDTASALKKAHQAWEKQVKVLMDRLASEKFALRRTNSVLVNNDVGIASQPGLAPRGIQN
ncbi:hypothetical protein ABZ208_08945 [Streptomyces sp. NPDC006208]|uniref:hypothetical protein n=1 Tax=Streptomyces sp. NPDC006208 TaxID=3156734 RepID=UPI0033A3BB1F